MGFILKYEHGAQHKDVQHMLNNWTFEEKSKQIHPFIQVSDKENLEKKYLFSFFFFYPLFENNTDGKAIK